MNAIIALCHFCEAHGPCILFCTQAFHSAHDAQLMMDSAPPDKRLPSVEQSDSSSSLSSMFQPPPRSSDQCEACRSVSVDQSGFLSVDPSAQISYVSGQYPEQPQLYSVLRQACVRSLNCEVCPGREGPIVFGEDRGCHVLSHTFNLQDSQARGFSRLYSVIVLMMDRVFLINSWPFLVQHLRKLIDDLQAKAETVYHKESEEVKSSNLRSLRSSLTSMPGPDHLRCIRTNETGRSLIELTGDEDIFMSLHKYFVFLLKAGGQRVTECVLEGPPRVMATPEPSALEGRSAESLDQPVTVTDFQVMYVDGQPFFQSLRHLFKVLERSDFLELANHTLKGDQVIVRGSDVTTVTSIISVLKDLVPENCCRIVAFSQSYKEAFVCNFLGLAVGANIPKHVMTSDQHVLLDILPPLRRHYSRQEGGGASEGSWTEGAPLTSYKLMVYSAQQTTAERRHPEILRRLVTLLSSDVLSEGMLARGLAAIKEEWMNKVKVLYKFSQMGHLELPQRNERLTKLLQDILFVTHDDLPILQYWRSALSREYKAHLMQSERLQSAPDIQ